MRLHVLAAAERGSSSSLDAAMLDGHALQAALHRAGHDVELSVLPAPDASLASRGLAVLETLGILTKLALQRPAPEGVLVVAPPAVTALTADVVASLRNIPGAVLLSSLTTEARVRTGELDANARYSKVLSALETAVVRRARVLLVPTEGLRRRVLLRGADPDRVHILKEMFAPIIPVPEAAQVARLRGRLAEGAQCLVVVPAALGASTDLGALTGALTRLKDDHMFALAAVGGGTRAETLKEMIAARGIKNAQVLKLTRADRRAAVHAADILLGIAVPAHDGLCVPRALTRALWAGKPLVAVGPEGSDLIREVKRLGVGPTVLPGDGDGLATVLRSLALDAAARADLATRARDAGAAVQSPVAALTELLNGTARPTDARLTGAPA
jgi:hypothetical protein